MWTNQIIQNVTLLYDNSHQNNLRYASAIYAPLGLPTLNGIDDEKRHAIVVWTKPKFEASSMITRLNKNTLHMRFQVLVEFASSSKFISNIFLTIFSCGIASHKLKEKNWRLLSKSPNASPRTPCNLVSRRPCTFK